MKIINDTARAYSHRLAEEKGCFPNWDISIYGPKAKNYKMRNSALTTVAPTGSISMLLDCSSGVEPFFALAYSKEVMGGQNLSYINPHLEKELKRLGLHKEEIISEIERTGSVQHIESIPAETKKVFVTAMDINAEDHIKMQAAFQSHVDNSISKTINFPYTATREDVRKGYVLAWESGLKGCTVYRDGSRQEQVLTIKKEEPKKKEIKENPKIEHQTSANFEEILPPPVKEIAQEREHSSIHQHTSLNKKEIIASKKCPECGALIQIAEGCMLCLSCGFSACSV
jgi:ribonucleoside-diphosphate reductase alpha chain